MNATARRATPSAGTQNVAGPRGITRRTYEPKVRATRLSLITIEAYMKIANTPVAVPGPYISRRNMAIPPDEGNASESLTYEWALKPTTMAATMNANGNRSPVKSAVCPVNAKIPAPIMTPVPSDTAPARLKLPGTSSGALRSIPFASSIGISWFCLLYTSDAADDLTRVDLG